GLFVLQPAGTDGGTGAPPYPCFEAIRNGSPALSGLAAFGTDQLRIEIGGRAGQGLCQGGSGNYFEVLGLEPAAGRLMTAADDELSPAVAVIGYRYWQRRF